MACLLAIFLFLSPFMINGGGMSARTASAASNDRIEVQRYTVDMTVREDRKIEVKESIQVEFLRRGLTMFYRSLPTNGARYEDITATCAGNDKFSYNVAANPEQSGFIDINCEGNADQGKVWTYDICYVMEQAAKTNAEGMIIDVIGFGWTVDLHEVTATVHLPEKPTAYQIYSDIFGAQTDNEVQTRVSEDGKTIAMYTPVLKVSQSGAYDERVAGGLTLEFTLPDGVLQNYTKSRMFTEDIWKIALGGIACIAFAFVLLVFTKKKGEMITVVNITAPDKMDPLQMGKWLDGTVNNEDITSMVYYFANQGFLKIDLSDEDDPMLIRCIEDFPEELPVHQATLFNGLFKKGDKIKVSELEGEFFTATQIATKQVPDAPAMYEPKSTFGCIGGAIVGALFGLLVPLIMSKRIGGGYTNLLGLAFCAPLALNAVIWYFAENYRFKWKTGKRFAILSLQWLVAGLFTLVFCAAFVQHIMTGYEKLLLCIFALPCGMITQSALSRTEKYEAVLGDILGFKEFIVVTEEDKIKFMLEENPELYYKVLPYAQVLGVTDEWENKFKRILLPPPTWCSATQLTTLDYLLIDHAIRRSMLSAMVRSAQAAASKAGGSFVGRSGGGGSFGGFGGGGFGGGGGGAR
ncbi:MAG: DUF2207 domain-containing protein [Clostridia bacterium]|nr:DUF2207 domain-containing protein [Clostridia bacterium]